MKKIKPPGIHIGAFNLGNENVDLFCDPDELGGHFDTLPDEKRFGQITVGLNYRNYDDVLATLLHETFEYLCSRLRTRYRTSCKFNGDSADYLFVFDHSVFGEICSRQALFIYQCGAKVHAAWKKHGPKK